MFRIDNKNNIHITRGDIMAIKIGAKDVDGNDYQFKVNDLIRFGIYEAGNMNKLLLQKDILVRYKATSVDLSLTSEETRLGSIINKPVNYWYEIQLNPDTLAQTIIGYDEEGAKLFILYPEGVDINE